MGRPRCFNREDVLKKAIPIFWKKGFADTSLQDLEKSTGVNKSGLYSEFKDKEDLFLSSLDYYITHLPAEKILLQEPLGWKNIQNLLTTVQACSGQKGCFVANSVRELQVLPKQAHAAIGAHLARLKGWIAQNIKAAHPKANSAQVAELILTFHAGLCLEQNFTSASHTEKIENFLTAVKQIS